MDTNLCVIRLSEGERIGDVLGKVLDTPDMTTIGAFAVSKENPTELHFHDFDEYWYFTEGMTTVTLRNADGQSESYRIGPGILWLHLKVLNMDIPQMMSLKEYSG